MLPNQICIISIKHGLCNLFLSYCTIVLPVYNQTVACFALSSFLRDMHGDPAFGGHSPCIFEDYEGWNAWDSGLLDRFPCIFQASEGWYAWESGLLGPFPMHFLGFRRLVCMGFWPFGPFPMHFLGFRRLVCMEFRTFEAIPHAFMKIPKASMHGVPDF